MNKKSITIKNISKLKKNNSPLPSDIADKWVNEVNSPNISENKYLDTALHQEEEIRFTVVLPIYLHKRVKKYCASNSISMKKKITQIFLDSFPET